MLSELRVENLLLISSLELELERGFNAFTGETGAGKSLLLDAIGFLLGARGDAEMVRKGAEQAEVSARFSIRDRGLAESFSEELGIVFEFHDGEAELVLSRTIPRTGRARAYANGRPIALPALKDLGERLLDIHGQHENQSLLRPATRLEVLDRFASAMAEREAAQRCYREALAAAESLAQLRRNARENEGRLELLRFQLQELEGAKLDEIDPDTLENEARLLRGAEKIRDGLRIAANSLDAEDGEGAAQFLGRAAKALHALGDAGHEVASLRDRLDAALAEAREIAREIDTVSTKARSDPARLAELEDARAKLRSLERKHNFDLAGLRGLRDRLRNDLAEFQNIGTAGGKREAALQKANEVLAAAAAKLSRKRRAAARDLEKSVAGELKDLGLASARIQFTLAPHEKMEASAISGETLRDEALRLLPATIKSSGAESLEILFSANPGLPLKPVQDCASGGEISRVMLAIKTVLARVSGADRLPVVVFDEVDSGVGGRLGAVLGRKLRELSSVRQVICVTHQPQLAACAQRQFSVSKAQGKNEVSVRVEMLDGARRVEELAAMLRGSEASALTLEEAKAMLKEAKKL